MNPKKLFRTFLKPRPRDSHKGDYGRVFILAGSHGMSGASVLTAQAALLAGAGLVTVGIPKSLTLPLARRMTEAMTKPLAETQSGTLASRAYVFIRSFLKSQDVLAIGPGLSQNPDTQTLIRRVIKSSNKPMVIDADGLNAFKYRASELKTLQAPAILTPHPGEFVRLFGGKAPVGDADRKNRALDIASRFKVIVVLKGHRTVVASPGGKVFVNVTGNPGMATGGSGDVLTGIIAAVLARKKSDPFLTACFGVYIHGLAGDLAAKEKGEISLIASDLTAALPGAFKKLTLS